MAQDLPQYRGSIYLDGYTYHISLRIHEGQRHISGEVPHSHSQYELHAVFNGTAMLEQEGFPPVCLETGDCAVMPPHTYHLRRLGSDDTRCCTMYIDIPKGIPYFAGEQECIRLLCAPKLIQLLNTLESEFAVRQLGSDGCVQSLLTLILVAVIRELSNLPKSIPTTKPPVFAQREESIDNYFASHYFQDISAKDLAAYLGITTRQLARVMQKKYGCTFRQHLQEIRLYHARQQLTNTDLSILQIANDCGFTCQGAFATAFRKQSGCTPSQFRKRKDLNS